MTDYVITNNGMPICRIISNHSMSLTDAIQLVGKFVPVESSDEPDVEIDGEYFYYDDLDLILDIDQGEI